MRTFVWHALVALALGAVAGVCVAGSVLERGIGLAQREVVSLNLIAAERAYADIARHLGYTDKIPWLLRRTRQEIVAKRAAVRYWQGDYASLVNGLCERQQPGAAKQSCPAADSGEREPSSRTVPGRDEAGDTRRTRPGN